jgi:hypothetical protein
VRIEVWFCQRDEIPLLDFLDLFHVGCFIIWIGGGESNWVAVFLTWLPGWNFCPINRVWLEEVYSRPLSSSCLYIELHQHSNGSMKNVGGLLLPGRYYSPPFGVWGKEALCYC